MQKKIVIQGNSRGWKPAGLFASLKDYHASMAEREGFPPRLAAARLVVRGSLGLPFKANLGRSAAEFSAENSLLRSCPFESARSAIIFVDQLAPLVITKNYGGVQGLSTTVLGVL